METGSQENLVDLNGRGDLTPFLKSVFESEDGFVTEEQILFFDSLEIDLSHISPDQRKHDLHRLNAGCLTDFQHLTSIKFVALSLKDIDQGVFRDLPKLESLTIEGCSSLVLEPDSLVFPKSLLRLSLTNSGLAKLDPKWFDGLTSLEMLNLSGNAVSEIDDGVFSALVSLQTLNLSYNPMQKCLTSQSFRGLDNLRTLTISHVDSLQIEPAAFEHFAKLKELVLQDVALDGALPDTLFRGMSDLEYLNLRENHISHLIVGSFDHLTELRNLDLSRNELKFIEGEVFCHTTNLEQLNLRSNCFESALSIDEKVFESLTHLKDFDVTGNPAEKFDRVRLGLNSNTRVSWDETIHDYYQMQIESQLLDQDESITFSRILPKSLVSRVVGKKNVQLSGVVKHSPLIVFILFILWLIPIPISTYAVFAIICGYCCSSTLIFLMSYRRQYVRKWQLISVNKLDVKTRAYLEEKSNQLAQKYRIGSPPQIWLSSNDEIRKPLCEVIGLKKNSFMLCVNPSLFYQLNVAELDSLLDERFKEVYSGVMRINMVFRGAFSPSPDL